MDIDLKTMDGRSRLLEMVQSADVLLDPFRPGVLDRLGLGDPVLLTRGSFRVRKADSDIERDTQRRGESDERISTRRY